MRREHIPPCGRSIWRHAPAGECPEPKPPFPPKQSPRTAPWRKHLGEGPAPVRGDALPPAPGGLPAENAPKETAQKSRSIRAGARFRPAACGRAQGQGGCASRQPRSGPEEAVPPWRRALPAMRRPSGPPRVRLEGPGRADGRMALRSLACLHLFGVEAHAMHALHALEGNAYAGHLPAARANRELEPSTAAGTPSAQEPSIRPCSRERCPAGRSAGWGPRPTTPASRARRAPWSALPRRRQPAPPHASCPAAESSGTAEAGNVRASLQRCPLRAFRSRHQLEESA